MFIKRELYCTLMLLVHHNNNNNKKCISETAFTVTDLKKHTSYHKNDTVEEKMFSYKLFARRNLKF